MTFWKSVLSSKEVLEEALSTILTFGALGLFMSRATICTLLLGKGYIVEDVDGGVTWHNSPGHHRNHFKDKLTSRT